MQSMAPYRHPFRYFKSLWSAYCTPSSENTLADIDFWRDRILTAALVGGMVLGGIPLISALLMAVRNKLWGLAIFDIIVYFLVISLIVFRRINLKLRISVSLLILYAIGLFVLVKFGSLSGGSIFLFTFAVLAGVLLNIRAALVALFINACTLIGLRWMQLSGIIQMPGPFFPSDERAMVAMMSFMLLNGLTAIAVATMTRGLQISIQKEATITYRLQEEINFRRRAEAKSFKNEARYKLLAENVTDVILSMDMQLKFTYFSPSVEQVLGYTPQEACQKTMDTLMTPASVTAALNVFYKELERHQQGTRDPDESVVIELALIAKDGGIVTIEGHSNFLLGPTGQPEAIIGVARDITKRKQAETALQESEEKFRLTFESSPDSININRLEDGLYVDINEGFTDITGYTREETIGRTSAEINIWHDLADRQKLVAGLREKGYYENLEAQFRKKDGSLTTGLMSARVITINGVPHIISITRDIGDRKRTEAELQRLMAAIEQAGEIVIITNAAGIIQYVNPAFERKSGYTRPEALDQHLRLIYSDHHPGSFYRTLWDTISSGNRWTGQVITKMKNDQPLTTECRISPVTDGTGRIVNYVWIAHDISKELELERRVSQAQKMEAIGSLAGGIAHDFNNLLFPIMGMAEMLLEDLLPGSDQHENVQEIHTAAKRASELVKQILVFSRQSEHKKIPVRIQKVLTEVIKLSRSTIPANIAIQSHIDPDLGFVLADSTQLHQIAMNLITNAFHAVEGSGGSITVRAHETEIGPQHLSIGTLAPGPYVVLSIADTGSGIDESVIDKIFEPYFTTKEQGKGTGLGLSVVYGIVRDHHGDIRVHSELGQGTTFEVFLPRMQRTTAIGRPVKVSTDPGGHERILLVDDEEPIVKLEHKILERLGYQVTPRTSPVEALEAFRADPGRFDLVITDMTMPNLTGAQLAREMFAIRPGMPIIIATGFSETMDPEQAEALGISGFLMKPMVKSELANMIRDVLDKVRPQPAPTSAP